MLLSSSEDVDRATELPEVVDGAGVGRHEHAEDTRAEDFLHLETKVGREAISVLLVAV